MPIIRVGIAVLVAGVVGTLANSAIVAALTANEFVPLAVSAGRNAVAVAVALLLPALFAIMPRIWAALTGILLLDLVPSLLAKTVFGVGAPWGFVLGVNAIYACAALLTYVAMIQPAKRAV